MGTNGKSDRYDVLFEKCAFYALLDCLSRLTLSLGRSPGQKWTAFKGSRKTLRSPSAHWSELYPWISVNEAVNE
jgi:hypothetical protein